MTWTPPEHDPEVELRDTLSSEAWREPIQIVARRHGLDSSDLFPFPTGSDIVWSAGAHVVKLTAPRWTDEIAAEAHGLRRAAGSLPVRTPTVEAVGELAGWPYLVMSHVPGRPLGELWAEADAGERRRLAGDLGHLTRSLHGLAGEDEAQEWPAFWARCTDGVPERHAARGAPPELVEQIAPLLDELAPLESARFGFLHTELLDAHVLAEERAGRVELCGLIDFADSCVGPVEYEFAAPVDFLFRGEPGALRAFLLAYGEDPARLDAARSRELLAWSLCHRFGSLPRMLAACAGWTPRSLDELASRLFDLEP